MAVDRQVPTSATPGAVLGDVYMDAVSEEITKLYDVSHITLGTVAGTADVITAIVVPALVGALVDGMKFTLPTGGSANTTAATLDIDGTARDIVRHDGSATEAGDLPADARVPLEYDAANARFVIMHPPQAAQGARLDRQAFTSSGTWTKPAGLDADALVFVELWGAGAGGGDSGSGRGGGGGGGAYVSHFFRAGDLGATEAVTIGAGGAKKNDGGNTTFSTITAYGGYRGTDGLTSKGGGGGGATSAGSANAGGDPIGGAAGSPGGPSTFGGGGPGEGPATGGSSYWGGGGGGSDTSTGGASVYGGGGGGGGGGGSAGTSILGGNGGASGASGSPPGGGGGGNAAGARGEARIRVIG